MKTDPPRRTDEVLPPAVSERITALRRILFRAAFLERLTATAVWVFFAAGLVVLGVRMAVPSLASLLPWLLLSAPLTALTAALLARSQRPSSDVLITLSDILGSGGGLLMAVAEHQDRAWAHRLPATLSTFPLPKVRPTRNSLTALFALLFFGAGFLVPQRQAKALPQTAVAEAVTTALTEQLALVEEVALTTEEEEELREAIEKLREELVRKVDPASLEAAGEIARRLAEKVLDMERAVERSARELEALARKLAPRAQDAGKAGELTNADSEKLKNLAQGLCKAGVDLKLDAESQELLNQLLNREGGKKLSREEAQRLAEALRQSCEKCAGRLAAQKTQLGKLAKDGMFLCCAGGLAAGLVGDKPGAGWGDKDGQGTKEGGDQPGRGGITEGPADAPFFWGKEVWADTFKETVAPADFIFETDTDLTFETFTEPELNPERSPAASPRERAAAAGVPHEETRLPPRHRKVVKKYFSQGARK